MSAYSFRFPLSCLSFIGFSQRKSKSTARPKWENKDSEEKFALVSSSAGSDFFYCCATAIIVILNFDAGTFPWLFVGIPCPVFPLLRIYTRAGTLAHVSLVYYHPIQSHSLRSRKERPLHSWSSCVVSHYIWGT